MILTHETNYLRICKDTSQKFIIYFKNPNQRYTNNIIHSIVTTVPTSFTDTGFSYIRFTASQVVPLKEYLQTNINITYQTAHHMLFSLWKQQSNLLEGNNSIIALSVNDIIVIDHKYFFCINPNILSCNHNQRVKLSLPLDNDYFVSPQITKAKQIPLFLSLSTFHYSLASIIIYSLFNIKLSCLDENTHRNVVEETLLPIFSTKLYSCLSRMLAFNEDNRTFLFV